MLKKIRDFDFKKFFTLDNFKNSYAKFFKGVKKYLSTNILFLSYVLSSIFIGLMLRYFTLGNISEFKALVCDITICAILGSFGYLFKPKNQFKYFISLNVFYTILCIINHIYYTFYNSFVSVSLLSTLSMLADVSDSVTSKLELIYFIYLLGPIIMIVVHKVLLKKKYYMNVSNNKEGKSMFIKTSVTGLVIVFLVLVTLASNEASRLVKQWNRDFYSTRSSKKEKNEYTNIFEGKNVVFIHAESIQNFLIDLEVNNIEITPNLNKLSREGMYFSSFYPQISIGTSSDTEFTLSTGLLPSSSGTVFVNFYNRKYETMQNLFNDQGYYTFSAHANNADYWNRKTMYKTLGYKDFFAKDSYIVPEDTNSSDWVGLGLSDKSFLHQVIDKLKDIKANHTNFMGTIITLSNHSPFEDVDKYGDLDFSITFDKGTGEFDQSGKEIKETVTVPYLEDTQIGNYLKSSHYADEALGQFIEGMDEAGLLENTVIIIYGDHDAKLKKSEYEHFYNYNPATDSTRTSDDPDYVKIDYYWQELNRKVPFIIWTKDKKYNEEVTHVWI